MLESASEFCFCGEKCFCAHCSQDNNPHSNNELRHVAPGVVLHPPSPPHPRSSFFPRLCCARGGCGEGGDGAPGGLVHEVFVFFLDKLKLSNLLTQQIIQFTGPLTQFIYTNGGHSVIQNTEFSDCVRGVPGFLDFDKCPPSSPRY